MKPLFSFLAVGAGIIILSMASLQPIAVARSEDEDPEEVTTVTGTVEVAEEDEYGSPTQVYIEAEKADYLVAPEGAGVDLLDHVGDWVEATGRAYESEDSGDFDYILYVESYTTE